MVGRGELTDQAWWSVEPLLPTSRRRGLATRYEKRAVNSRAMLDLASIALWLEG